MAATLIGACYVAYGHAARAAVGTAIKSLRKQHPDLPVTVIGDEPPVAEYDNFVTYTDPGFGARNAKLHLLDLCPYSHIVYLDADTVVNGDLAPGFAILSDGYDLAIAPSINQGTDIFSHIESRERIMTTDTVPCPLQLQAGVMFIQRNAATRALFATWQTEWQRYAQHDQAALIRALDKQPVKIWLLSNEWNGGALISHNFGKARA